METHTASSGTEEDERSGRFPTWKAILGKRKVLLKGLGAAFVLLLLTKIILSALYLQSTPLHFSTAGVALAQDKAVKNPFSGKMQMLKKKEDELEAREKLLEKKEETLLPLQKEVDEKLSELSDLQVRLTAYAKDLADREKALKDAKINHLVALYSAMDPVKAAAIMDKLKIDIIVRILANMKGKSAGKILAMMEPERGAVISEKLSQAE
ncbi:MotE family protein [Thermodesulfobacteriota bacterium]